MSKVKGRVATESPTLTPGAGINAGNYLDRAKAFASLGGQCFLIRGVEGTKGSLTSGAPATDAEWLAWVGYFETKAIPCAFLRQHGLGTVPSQFPEFFDTDALPSDRDAKIYRHSPHERRDRQDRISALMPSLLKTVEAWVPDRKRPTQREAKQTAIERLAALEADRAKPLNVGPALQRNVQARLQAEIEADNVQF